MQEFPGGQSSAVLGRHRILFEQSSESLVTAIVVRRTDLDAIAAISQSHPFLLLPSALFNATNALLPCHHHWLPVPAAKDDGSHGDDIDQRLKLLENTSNASCLSMAGQCAESANLQSRAFRQAFRQIRSVLEPSPLGLVNGIDACLKRVQGAAEISVVTYAPLSVVHTHFTSGNIPSQAMLTVPSVQQLVQLVLQDDDQQFRQKSFGPVDCSGSNEDSEELKPHPVMTLAVTSKRMELHLPRAPDALCSVDCVLLIFHKPSATTDSVLLNCDDCKHGLPVPVEAAIIACRIKRNAASDNATHFGVVAYWQRDAGSDEQSSVCSSCNVSQTSRLILRCFFRSVADCQSCECRTVTDR